MSDDSEFAQLAARAPLHLPGEEVVFDLTLRNRGNDPWRARHCVELLNTEHSLVILGQDEIVLNPGEQLTVELQGRLPDDLPVGVYDLALVIPGRFWAIGNLPNGDAGETSTRSWPEPSYWKDASRSQITEFMQHASLPNKPMQRIGLRSASARR